MTKLELISLIYDALEPLLMFFYGLLLGPALAEWWATRQKKEKKPDPKQPEGEAK